MNRNEINNYTKQSSLNVTPSAGVSFSALTLNQHRSKATPSRMSVADAMWLEEEEQFGAVGRVDGEEEEDPFEGDEGEMLPSQCFEPVRDSEGFIRAREVPQLKMSRSVRLALHARSDYDLDTRRTRALCGPLLSQPVEVELMELVVDKDRRRDRYSSRLDRATEREDDRRSGLKNFKRFRKTDIGSSHDVCQVVRLMVYVPVVSHELPDWDTEEAQLEEEEEDGSGSRMTPGSQDFNVFSLNTRKRRRP